MAGRRKPEDDSADDARWLTTYGDAVTLLMAFFVMLYAMSQVDQEKFDAFVSGLKQFGNPGAVESLFDQHSGVVGPGGARSEAEAAAQLSKALSPPSSSDDTFVKLRQQMEAVVKSKGLQASVSFDITDRGFVVSISTDKVLFETGSAVLSHRGREIIGALAPALKKLSSEILIEGHTDNTPLHRAGYTNWNLSTDRAVAVVHLLAGGHGISPKRLAATGYGEFRPKATNSTSTGRATNRRVELVIPKNGGENGTGNR